MTLANLNVVHELYSKLIARNTSYRERTLNEVELLIGYSLEHGGFGYIIRENGIPKGYVWCEDGNCVEGPATGCWKRVGFVELPVIDTPTFS